MSLRPITRLIRSKPTLEGAGVHLRRAFGFGNTAEFDPFLLLDDFRNDIPADYLAGFPWHPHRGLETITYVLAGTVEHGDSLGNRGPIGPGEIQWMTGGRGIIHQEMPKGDRVGQMHGFQLWANLPSSLKMTAPRYQEVKAGEIPEITDDEGIRFLLVSGKPLQEPVAWYGPIVMKTQAQPRRTGLILSARHGLRRCLAPDAQTRWRSPVPAPPDDANERRRESRRTLPIRCDNTFRHGEPRPH